MAAGSATAGGRQSRTYEVVHRTLYRYDAEVGQSYGRAHLVPRDAAGQWCRWYQVDVTPRPANESEHVDYFGNRSLYFEVLQPHTELEVISRSRVEVDRRGPDARAVAGAGTWQEAAEATAAPEHGEAREFLLRSPLVEVSSPVAAFAREAFRPGRPAAEAVMDLVHRIHDGFVYQAGVTSVSTTLPEVLRRREGVCQDFAHLAVGCLRSVGLPARYVSGYLETDPPPGRPRLQGADASHAWASVYLPGAGWLDIDPTNDQAVDARYVVTAWGRDYGDVPPLKGVIFTDGADSTLDVAVDVVRVDTAASPPGDGTGEGPAGR